MQLPASKTIGQVKAAIDQGQRQLSMNVAIVRAPSALLVVTILEINVPIAAQVIRVSVEFC